MRPMCPWCKEPLELVVIEYARREYTIARTKDKEEDFGINDLEWTRAGYCCPNCMKEIGEDLAEEVFALNEEEE